MKNIYMIFIACCYAIGVSAQTTVSGKVEDQTRKALQGCTVLFMQADSIVGGTITNQKGYYEIKFYI